MLVHRDRRLNLVFIVIVLCYVGVYVVLLPAVPIGLEGGVMHRVSISNKSRQKCSESHLLHYLHISALYVATLPD